jgi:predicted aspartyl protease
MSYTYARQAAFPFPVLPVRLYRAEGAAITPVINAQIDTGAEITIVPAKYLSQVEDDFLQTVRLRSHWGEPRPFRMYVVDLLIGTERLAAVEVVAENQGNEILLGRNILNKTILLLDGPSELTDLLLRRPARLATKGR